MADTTGAGGFSLASILNQISDLQKNLSGDTAEGEKTVQENVRLGLEQAAGAKKVIDLSVDQAQIENTQRLELEARKKATMDTFNVDILNPENQLAYLAREQNAAVRESIDNSKRASELRSTGMMESPMDYFINRPFATQNDQAATNAATRATMIDKAIDDLNAATQSTVKTQEAVAQNFTADQAANRLQLVGIQATQKANEIALSVNRNNLQDLQVLRGMKTAEIAQATKGYELSRHEAEFNARMEEMRAGRDARLAAKKGVARSNEELMMTYNAGAKDLNKKLYTSATDFSETLRTPMGQQLLKPILEHGMNMVVDNEYANETGKPVMSVIGRTTGDAVAFLGQVRGQLAPTAQRTADFLSSVYGVAKTEVVATEKDGKVTNDQIATRIDEKLTGKAKKDEKTGKVIPGAGGFVPTAIMNPEVPIAVGGRAVPNPYAAPDVGTLLTSKPDIAEEPWFKAIVIPAATATGKDLARAQPSGDQLFQQAKLAVTSGELTLDQAAAGLNQYFGEAILANMANEQYQRVGLPIPKSYNFPIDSSASSIIGRGTTVVDGLKVEQIKHELAKTRVMSMLQRVQKAAPLTKLIPESGPSQIAFPNVASSLGYGDKGTK